MAVPSLCISNKTWFVYCWSNKKYWTKKSLNCNRVAMKDTSTGKLARYNLFMENVGKDMGIDQMFEQIYYNEFNEKGTQIGRIDKDVKQL